MAAITDKTPPAITEKLIEWFKNSDPKMRINPAWRLWKPWIKKWIPVPSPMTEFMTNIFAELPIEKPIFMNFNKYKVNPDRKRWQFWKPRFIENPDYIKGDPYADIVEFDIVRGSKIKAFAAGKTRILPMDIKFDFVDDVDAGENWNEYNCDPLRDIENYRKRILNQMRISDPYKDAVNILDTATMYNLNIFELVPLGGCNNLTELECIKLAQSHPFSLEGIKQIFWNGRP